MHGNDGYAIQRHVHLVTNNKRVAQCKRDESCSFMSNIGLAVLCWAYAANRYIFDVYFKKKYSIYACSMIDHPTTMRHWTIKMPCKILGSDIWTIAIEVVLVAMYEVVMLSIDNGCFLFSFQTAVIEKYSDSQIKCMSIWMPLINISHNNRDSFIKMTDIVFDHVSYSFPEFKRATPFLVFFIYLTSDTTQVAAFCLKSGT